jgi:ribonuclease P/MRP protein subunit POP7
LVAGSKIQKRPLLHPAIASTRAGAQTPKIVYISTGSPFISTTKRIRKYLAEIDKRDMGKVSLLEAGDDREKVRRAGKGRDGGGEEVLVKATGKAIEKALQVALHFQGQEDCTVNLRTGSVGAVDDVIAKDGAEEEVSETRIRRTSMLEVRISLR